MPVAGPRPAWLVLGPCAIERREIDRYLKFLRPIVAQYLQNTLEVEHAANDTASSAAIAVARLAVLRSRRPCSVSRRNSAAMAGSSR